jgi:Ca2+-binding RTX toxin-like protein
MSTVAQMNTQVTQLYISLFNRAPDAQGLDYWSGKLAAGMTTAQVADIMYSVAPARLYYPASFSNGQIVDAFYVNNLGRAPDAEGRAYWIAQLDSKGLGQVISNIIAAVVAYPGSDTAALNSQALFNNKVAVGEHFAEILRSNDITLASNALIGVTFDAATVTVAETRNTVAVNPVPVDIPPGTGATIALTSSADTGSAFTGTAANDTFTATYNAAVTDTFNLGDSINGAGGTDTLRISHFFDVAITPPDALWAGVRGVENVIFDTTQNGAQTITTGAQFEAAFHGNGVAGIDMTTMTAGAGATTIDMGAFGGTATITATTIAGAQAIVTGSGVSTVNSASAAGALTIMGVGLTTVVATTTGAGAQTIGDAGGNGVHLVSVTATANSGAQTITSTSTSAAHVQATSISGPQTILTGAGADVIIASSGVGTQNTIGSGAGDDLINAGLGNDVITGGTGADTITGGGGIDTFMFGPNGSLIGVAMDVITDFNTAGADFLNFGATTAVLAPDATALVAGGNVQTTAGGLVIFHAADNSLALKISAVEADTLLDTAGTIAIFVDGGNTYVYYAGTAAGNADDQLVQLTGITSLVTITGGSTTTII